jgi:protein-tyrosine phosphatase
MAEGAFLNLLKKKNSGHLFHIDSAGTAAYHIGKPADHRMSEIASEHGVELPSTARQVTLEDFARFDYIIAMDRSNLNDLLQMAPRSRRAEIVLMRDYDSSATFSDVPDPYYGGQAGFTEVYEIVTRSCETFYNEIHSS